MRHLRALPNPVESTSYETHNTNWQDSISSFLTYLRAGGSPETTIYTRRQHLEHAAKRLPAAPFAVTASELTEYFAAQGWKPETRRGRRATFRKFYTWAIQQGHTHINPADALPSIKPAQPKPKPAPDNILAAALLKASPRERLMIRLAEELGLRRAEVAVIHTSDLIETPSGLCLVVHGKGAKDRTLPLTDGLAAVLSSYPEGYIFPGDDNGHLSPRYVGKLMSRLLPEGWTMHTLRHRFATRAYALDNDVFAVQEFLGHASPATTRMYVKLPDDRLRSMVNRLAS